MRPEVLKSRTLKVDYSRASCLGADQKTRGLWEREYPKHGAGYQNTGFGRRVPSTGGKAVLGLERKSSFVFTAVLQEFLHRRLSHETELSIAQIKRNEMIYLDFAPKSNEIN